MKHSRYGAGFAGLALLSCMLTAQWLSAQPAGEPLAPERVTICHIPPGNPDNARTITVSERAVSAHLAHGDFLGACDASPFPSFVVDAVSDRNYGSVGTVFEFTATVVSEEPVEIQRYEWTLENGQVFTGPDLAVSFDTPGFKSIVLTATAANGDVETVDTGAVVHAAGELAPPALGLPQPFGDVDGDGAVTLADVHDTARFIGRLAPLDGDRGRDAADFNLTGDVELEDALLIAETVMSDQALPDRLLTDSGPPGSVITLVSDRLTNPDELVEISIGPDDQRQTVSRPVLGFVNFIVPFTGAAAQPGEQTVRLLIDGVEARSYAFTVVPPAPIPVDPIAELNLFFDEIDQLLATNETLIAEQLDRLGITGDSREIFLAAAAGGRVDYNRVVAELRPLLETSEGTALAETFFQVANANGLPQLRAELQQFQVAMQQPALLGSTGFTTAAFSPTEVCDQLLPALCALQQTADLIDTASGVVSTSCDILLIAGLGGTLTGVGTKPAAAALILWANVCAPLELALDVSGVVTDLVSDVDQDLRSEVTNPAPEPGESTIIKATLDVFGLDDICQIGGSAGTDKLVERLAERAVARLLRRKIAARAVERIFTFLGEDILKEFFRLLQDGASAVITGTGVDEAILNFAGPYCEDLFGAELIVDASRVLTGPQPDIGSLAFLGDGTAEYTCPDDTEEVPESGIEFNVEKEICDETQTLTEIIQCGLLRDVTITMGDNGFLNDDIYEVLVDGESVLTSSQPVRSISTTIQLPAASQSQVQMLGRAAPDGIGTYFIRFSGAMVISGDALSGTDLVPGAVKNYTIQVQE